MSDIPRAPEDGGEEFDLGEIEDAEEGIDDAAEGDEQTEDGAEAPESDDEAEEGEAEPPRRARRPGRNERLRAENARLAQELAEARGFRQAAEQFRTPVQPQGPSPAELAEQRRQEDERLSLMSPMELLRYGQEQTQRQMQQAMLMQSLQMEDRIDRQSYENAATSSKFHRDHQAEVERRLNAERQSGNLRATRQSILSQIVGEQAMQRANSAAPRQRSAAAARVAGQQGRPVNGRGDGSAGPRRGREGDPDHDLALAREGLRKGYF